MSEDQDQRIHFRATIDKLSLALWGNTIANSLVALAMLMLVLLKGVEVL